MESDYETRSLLNDMEAQANTDDAEIGFPMANHCHALLLLHKEEIGVERALRAVAVLSAVFIVAELTGGIIADSLAIITDAGHLLSDFFSFIVSLVAIRYARRLPTQRATFGYARAEVIGALFSIFIIWALTIVLVVFATERIWAPEININANIMLATSLLAILFNAIMATILWCYVGTSSLTHSHSNNTPRGEHLDTTQSSYFAETRPNSTEMSKNVNIRAAFIHILGDFLQSIGVLVAALIIKFTGWTLADPLCTYLFSVIVLATSVPVLRDICGILLETMPSKIDYVQVARDLTQLRVPIENANFGVAGAGIVAKTFAPVKAIHSLHIWALNVRQLCASVHIVIDKSSLQSSIAISKAATRQLQYAHGIIRTTVQIDIDTNPPQGANHCIYCSPL